jgi:hypothetical protein
MHDEAHFWLQGPPREYTHGARDLASLLPKRFENAGDRGLADRLVDDDPESAAPIMLYDQDDGGRAVGARAYALALDDLQRDTADIEGNSEQKGERQHCRHSLSLRPGKSRRRAS